MSRKIHEVSNSTNYHNFVFNFYFGKMFYFSPFYCRLSSSRSNTKTLVSFFCSLAASKNIMKRRSHYAETELQPKPVDWFLCDESFARYFQILESGTKIFGMRSF